MNWRETFSVDLLKSFKFCTMCMLIAIKMIISQTPQHRIVQYGKLK